MLADRNCVHTVQHSNPSPNLLEINKLGMVFEKSVYHALHRYVYYVLARTEYGLVWSVGHLTTIEGKSYAGSAVLGKLRRTSILITNGMG
jgi:hypothetical protein